MPYAEHYAIYMPSIRTKKTLFVILHWRVAVSDWYMTFWVLYALNVESFVAHRSSKMCSEEKATSAIWSLRTRHINVKAAPRHSLEKRTITMGKGYLQ